MAKSCFRWPFVLWGFWVTNNHQQSFLEENHESALWRVSFELLVKLTSYFFNHNWFVPYIMYFVLQFSSFSDGWLMFQLDDVADGVATYIQTIALKCPELKRHGIHPLHLHLMGHKHFITLIVEQKPMFRVSHARRPRKWMDATWWTWMTCLKL